MMYLCFAATLACVSAFFLVDLSVAAQFGCAFIGIVTYTVGLVLFAMNRNDENGFQNW